MNICKKLICAATAVIMSITVIAAVFADGDGNTYDMAAVEVSETDLLDGITAQSAIVMESTTGTVLSEKNADEQRSISHLAKLMTLLIAAEKIDSGELSLDETVTVSAHANSMTGTQIWLEVGEKISVEELIKSITIGNANDGCVALAEKISGSEEEFVKLMNDKAKLLDMANTHFADSTGTDKETVSNARDLAVLANEIIKRDNFTHYFTTWIDNVRNQAVELVSTNRLIRTYKGITGLKSCSSADCGECLIATAKRNDMSVCVVLLGSVSDDDKFSEAKKLLDGAFSSYEIYTPEIDEEVFEKIKVTGGEKLEADVEVRGLEPIVIKKGTYPSVTCDFSKEESLSAPVSQGQNVGEIVYKLDDNVILKGDIVCKSKINKIGFSFALKKVLLNLLNF
ncbi:MAG: D-alanyl-D-alanine carboxypeptidase family protein [Oscillospiraceae bacterium]